MNIKQAIAKLKTISDLDLGFRINKSRYTVKCISTLIFFWQAASVKKHCRDPPYSVVNTKTIKYGGLLMLINLKDYYPQSIENGDVDIPQNIVKFLQESNREERNAIRKKYYYNAHYSLDADDQIEREILNTALSIEMVHETADLNIRLVKAWELLSDKQKSRIYAHHVLKISQCEIARIEQIHKNAIYKSIEQGLKKLRKNLLVL